MLFFWGKKVMQIEVRNNTVTEIIFNRMTLNIQ